MYNIVFDACSGHKDFKYYMFGYSYILLNFQKNTRKKVVSL